MELVERIESNSWTTNPSETARKITGDSEVDTWSTKVVQTSHTETLRSDQFVDYFTNMAKAGKIKKLTLHLPDGVAYGIGTISQNSGATNVNLNRKVNQFYTSSLIVLALALGIVTTLSFISRLTIFEAIISIGTIISVMIATAKEWRGWGPNG